MSAIDDLYEELAEGGGDVPDSPRAVSALADRAKASAAALDVAVRRGALRVAQALGPPHRTEILAILAADPDPALRQAAVDALATLGPALPGESEPAQPPPALPTSPPPPAPAPEVASPEDELYAAIASGDEDPPSSPHVRNGMIARAKAAAASPDPAERRRGLQVAEAFGPPVRSEILLDYTRDPDLEIRRQILQVAKDEVGPGGLRLLRSIATDPDPKLAVEAIRELAAARDRASTSVIRARLTASQPVVRAAAARFLGSVAGASLSVVLERLVTSDPDQGVQQAARDALAQIAAGASSPPTRQAAPAAPTTRELGPSPVDGVYEELARGKGELPSNPLHIKLLGRRAKQAAASREVAERAKGLAIARLLGPPQTAEIAFEYAHDADAGLLDQVYAIAMEAGPDGLRILRRLCACPEPGAAVRAIEALTAAQDRSATSALRGQLQSPSPVVRAAAARFLGQLAGPSMVPHLQRLLADPDAAVKQAAREALDALGEAPAARPAPSARTPGSDDSEVTRLLEALGADDADRDALAAKLAEVDPGMLSTAMRGITVRGRPALNRGIARAAIALADKRWASTVRRGADHEDPTVRADVADALGHLATNALLPRIVRLLDDGEGSVRARAALAIARAGSSLDSTAYAIQALAALEDDKDEAVKAARAEALSMLSGS